jgi:membrane protease YdiL (CAAX protease family)
MLIWQHLLAVFLFVGVPVWDFYETRALKTSTNPRRKILSYRRIVAVEWVASLLAYILLRARIFMVWPDARQAALQKIGRSFLLGFVFAFLLAMLLQTFLVRRNPAMREKTLLAFRRIAFILPVTREERSWFLAVCLTAGVCEEILYRGFLIRYLSDFPWHTTLWIGLGISTLAFGMAHIYQGLTGIIGTALLGALLAVIFFITGSLWLPIAIHALIDLRILFLVRPEESIS